MHLGVDRRGGFHSAEYQCDTRAVHKSDLAEVEAENLRSLDEDGAIDPRTKSRCRVVIYLTAYSRDKRGANTRKFYDFIVHFKLLVFSCRTTGLSYLLGYYNKPNMRILSLLRGEKYFF